jgi:hypothetical protein
MTRLKLSLFVDDKPVKLTVEVPAAIHRDLMAYAVLAAQSGQAVDPTKLIAPMLALFMANDRGFLRARKARHSQDNKSAVSG